MRPAATAQRRVVECMGTVFSFDVRAPGVEPAALDEAERWLRHVDATFSTYRDDSVISRLARGAARLADCPAEVRQVLAECERLQELTGGYFTLHPGGRLDPSGLVKGWAIERAADVLADAGSLNHCVNGGGDVQCAGEAAPGQPWRVGIAHPFRRGELVAVAVGSGIAVATSGLYERGGHIVDPTGSVPTALASISIAGTRLGETDAFATAAFAMGDAARAWVDAQPGYEAFAVRPDGSTWCTAGWA